METLAINYLILRQEFFSFTPGFSPVNDARRDHNEPFQRFPVGHVATQFPLTTFPKGRKSKPLKRFCDFHLPDVTGLKPGLNEGEQALEVRQGRSI